MGYSSKNPYPPPHQKAQVFDPPSPPTFLKLLEPPPSPQDFQVQSPPSHPDFHKTVR